MTSVVDKYYRRIIQNIDNVRMKLDISTLLVKSKEHDSKIDTNESNISDNKSKIDTNESNISSNLNLINDNKSLIDTNTNNISSNLNLINDNKSLIDTNTNNISSNLNLINDNKSVIDTNTNNISSNLNLINTNKTNITNYLNLTQINKKKSDNNTTFIDTNRDNITANLNTLYNIDSDLLNLRGRINDHQTDIQTINTNINDLRDGYKLKDITIVDIIRSNISETVDKNNDFVIIDGILNNLKKDSFLEFDSSITIYFYRHYINIGFFHILLEFFDDKNELIQSIKLPIIGMISKHAKVTNSCIIKLNSNYDTIHYKLSVKLNINQNRSDSVSIIDFNDNKIYFKYYE